jgi:hypothetical protein
MVETLEWVMSMMLGGQKFEEEVLPDASLSARAERLVQFVSAGSTSCIDS